VFSLEGVPVVFVGVIRGLLIPNCLDVFNVALVVFEVDSQLEDTLNRLALRLDKQPVVVWLAHKRDILRVFAEKVLHEVVDLLGIVDRTVQVRKNRTRGEVIFDFSPNLITLFIVESFIELRKLDVLPLIVLHVLQLRI